MIHIFHPDGRVLPLDATRKATVSNSITLATHPMEEGAPVVDHAEPVNEEVSFACNITETPTARQRDEVSADGTIVTKGKAGPSRVLAAVDFLKDCVGVKLDIEDLAGRVSYTDMLLKSYPFDMQLVRTSKFTLGFMKPRFVEPTSTGIPPRSDVPATITNEPPDEQGETEEKKLEKSIFFSLGTKEDG